MYIQCQKQQLPQFKGKENGTYISKKEVVSLSSKENGEIKLVVTFEYHIAYNINYGVPILCFIVWRQGELLTKIRLYLLYKKCNNCI